MSSLSPIIICRFILDLRQVEPISGNSQTSGSVDQSATLRFVGNAGGSLRLREDEDEDDEDEDEDDLGDRDTMAGRGDFNALDVARNETNANMIIASTTESVSTLP